jgi:hypothetical protein
MKLRRTYETDADKSSSLRRVDEFDNQCFTKPERFPENRGAGYARTPVFGLLLNIS